MTNKEKAIKTLVLYITSGDKCAREILAEYYMLKFGVNIRLPEILQEELKCLEKIKEEASRILSRTH